MEITSPSTREREKASPTNSPHSNGSSTTSSSSNGSSSLHLTPTPPHTPTPTHKPRSHEPNPNPYPTTFVQADTTTFKQVVQMLTGSSSSSSSDPPSARPAGIPPIKSTAQKKQGFKLYERRNSLKNGLMINTLIPSALSPRKQPELLSPSILDFPALVLSPVTPMNEDRTAADQEEKAIAEKKFYLHPSPRTDVQPPQLLPLFPLTSPRVSGSTS